MTRRTHTYFGRRPRWLRHMPAGWQNRRYDGRCRYCGHGMVVRYPTGFCAFCGEPNWYRPKSPWKVAR